MSRKEDLKYGHSLLVALKKDPLKTRSRSDLTHYSSRSNALKSGLTNQDLIKLESEAVVGKVRGQWGIFYPNKYLIGKIRNKIQAVPKGMIPEIFIKRGLCMNHKDLVQLRMDGNALWGKVLGAKGPGTYHYKKEFIREFLGIHLITKGMQEGQDYFSSNRLNGVQLELLPKVKAIKIDEGPMKVSFIHFPALNSSQGRNEQNEDSVSEDESLNETDLLVDRNYWKARALRAEAESKIERSRASGIRREERGSSQANGRKRGRQEAVEEAGTSGAHIEQNICNRASDSDSD